MSEIPVKTTPPGPQDLEEIKSRADSARARLQSDSSEARRPIIFEFAGSPKSGKSSLIAIISHFFKRAGFRVGQPAEGASLRTPPDLKDDLFAFNAWSACYALQNILQDAHAGDPEDILLLDRGLFDSICWMRLLESQQRLTPDDRQAIERFLLLDFWNNRVSGVFLFLADAATSLDREVDSKLNTQPGRAMNPEFLSSLLRNYKSVQAELGSALGSVSIVDTSFQNGNKPNFQSIAMEVARSMLDIIDRATVQQLLVGDRFTQEGFVRETSRYTPYLEAVIAGGRLMDREEAEATDRVQQLVPYGLLKRDDGRVLCLKRKTVGERKELAGKSSILVGGHAERKDVEATGPGDVFERCLRREIQEEIIGLEVVSCSRLGVLNDGRNKVGMRHLAVIHEVRVGGFAAARRQTNDREFGREAVTWLSPDEVKQKVADFDPWSQLVAEGRFGAVLPDADQGATLFYPTEK